MLQDKFNDMSQKVGGIDIANLLTNTSFISKKNNQPKLSFALNNIITIDGSEILKIELQNKNIVRLMKVLENNVPSITFDIVDDVKKEIVIKSNKLFSGAIGVSELLFTHGFITQWEIPIFTKICRCYLFGDTDTLRDLIEKYNLKINQDAWWHLKTTLGIK